jgi:hypothetical protein
MADQSDKRQLPSNSACSELNGAPAPAVPNDCPAPAWRQVGAGVPLVRPLGC